MKLPKLINRHLLHTNLVARFQFKFSSFFLFVQVINQDSYEENSKTKRGALIPPNMVKGNKNPNFCIIYGN